jgi:MFS family permease
MWLLPSHIAGVACLQATSMALQFMLPVLARKEFGASDLQTTVMTAATTAFFCLSIFWNDLFARMRTGPYLLLYWVASCLPLAVVGLVALAGGTVSMWVLLPLHLVACLGMAGYHPAAGELLRSLYPAATRGRTYGTIWGASMAFSAAMGYGLGLALEWDGRSYAWLLPAAAVVQLVGIVIIVWIAHASGHEATRTLLRDQRSLYVRVFEPITHMREVLRQDRVFFRYEAAYMTYGVGWMVAYALLPILVTDKLGLNYKEVSSSTHVAYMIAMIIMIVPAGLLLDRLGAVRSTGVSFALLTLYPVGLMLARDVHELAIVSVVYGIAHAGASMGWMLGPVALAPSQDRVPQYVAIHATLVGVRGLLFQFLGVGMYVVASRWLGWSKGWAFGLPLTMAAGAYVWSGWQMWHLDREMRAAKSAT